MRPHPREARTGQPFCELSTSRIPLLEFLGSQQPSDNMHLDVIARPGGGIVVHLPQLFQAHYHVYAKRYDGTECYGARFLPMMEQHQKTARSVVDPNGTDPAEGPLLQTNLKLHVERSKCGGPLKGLQGSHAIHLGPPMAPPTYSPCITTMVPVFNF